MIITRRLLPSLAIALGLLFAAPVPVEAFNVSTQAASAMLGTMAAQYNGGTLVMYSGTMPATPETALSGNTALATFTFSGTAYGSSSFTGGYQQATAALASSTVTPSAAGTVTWARAYQSNGTTVIADYTVGTSGTDIVIANTSLQTTVQVTISSLLLKIPGV